MYDLIFCVLTTTKKKNRLPFFHKNGYKKSDKYKIKIVYLVENEEKPEYVNEDIEWYNSNYHYTIRYLDYLKNTKDQSRWFLQVDDDSITDLDKTIEYLDKYYEFEDSLCLGSIVTQIFATRYFDRKTIGQLNADCYFEPVYEKILKKTIDQNINLNDIFVSPKSFSAWEYCILSKSAFNKISKFKKLGEFIENCKELKIHFSDESCFVLSNLLKITVSHCSFMTPMPIFEEYSGMNKNGRFTHIHHVCEELDQLHLVENIIQNNKIFENSSQVKNYFNSNLINSYWLFYKYDILSKQVTSRCGIKLLENKKVEKLNKNFEDFNGFEKYNLNYNSDSYTIKEWDFSNEEFSILVDERKFTFRKEEDNLYRSFTNNEIFILSKLNPLDLIYWSHKKFIYNFSKDLY